MNLTDQFRVGLSRVIALSTFISTILLSAGAAWAHSSSTSYITISADAGTPPSLRLDLPLRDLALRFDLDQDRDGAIRWPEVNSQLGSITSWINEGLKIEQSAALCRLVEPDWAAATYGEENYLSLVAQIRCPVDTGIKALSLSYTLFFDQDALHRGLIKASFDGITISAITSPDRPAHLLDPSTTGFVAVLGNYLTEGVWHIWIGADHILFLVSLLLPCVFLRTPATLGQWRPQQDIKSALTNVVAVVTAFTLAHSITLGLTVLTIITPPDGLVEPIIAASVIFAALGNLTKTLIHLRWQIALVFGLIHGFGFASVLADLGLPSDQLTATLLGFNIGVELGQLAIVTVFSPIAWKLRATSFYRWGFVFMGSIVIAMVALYWLADRL